MIIQYATDLHLEFSKNKKFLKANPLWPSGDILLLAGDIVPFVKMNRHREFFDYISDHFHTTYWVPGNHEYYHFNVAEKSGILNENIRKNVHLVNNVCIVKQGVRFIFSTLWAKIGPQNQWWIERSVRDFQVIQYNNTLFSVEHFNRLHHESIEFITAELSRPSNLKTVVVTHHVPTFLNYPEKYKGDLINEVFAIELFNLIETKKPDYWIYGHTHANTGIFNIGGTKMITNQLGYVRLKEHLFFDTNKTFHI
ncbi:MAG: metallophosphoesterase [Bacteroidales bacterium]